MPRIRSLKPDIWQSESLGSSSIEAMCLFVGLITQADDEGRLRGSVGRLRVTLFPYKTALDTARVEGWMEELTARGLIQRYDVDGKPFIALPGWSEHQRIAHPSSSDIPAPPAHRTGAEDEQAMSTSKGDNFAAPHETSRGLTSPPPGSGSGSGDGENTSASETLAIVARRLFTYWQEKCDHPTAKFTLERRRKVEGRLKDGYTEQQIRQGILGAAHAAFVNDAGKKFDDLELICRNGSKLESFVERAVLAPAGPKSSADIARDLSSRRPA